MAQYSFGFKKKTVQAYLNGEGGYRYLAEKYCVSAHSNVERWIKAYKEFGDIVIMHSRKYKNYSFQFKLSVVWKKTKIDIPGATRYTYKSTLAHVAVLEGRKMKDIRPMDIQMIYDLSI